jgi:trehalose/maltose hydrolase-like predicted phosphorylase
VVPTPFISDTSPEIERRQVESWREMTPAQKAALVSGLTGAAFAMTAAGVRQRHPGASPREQFLRVAIITLGRDLAVLAYPDAAEVMDV